MGQVLSSLGKRTKPRRYVVPVSDDGPYPHQQQCIDDVKDYNVVAKPSLGATTISATISQHNVALLKIRDGDTVNGRGAEYEDTKIEEPSSIAATASLLPIPADVYNMLVAHKSVLRSSTGRTTTSSSQLSVSLHRLLQCLTSSSGGAHAEAVLADKTTWAASISKSLAFVTSPEALGCDETIGCVHGLLKYAPILAVILYGLMEGREERAAGLEKSGTRSDVELLENLKWFVQILKAKKRRDNHNRLQSSFDNNSKKGAAPPLALTSTSSLSVSSIKSVESSTKDESNNVHIFSTGDEVDGLVTLNDGSQRWFPGVVVSVTSSVDSDASGAAAITYELRYNDGDVDYAKTQSDVRVSKKRNRPPGNPNPNLRAAKSVTEIETILEHPINFDGNSSVDNPMIDAAMPELRQSQSPRIPMSKQTTSDSCDLVVLSSSYDYGTTESPRVLSARSVLSADSDENFFVIPTVLQSSNSNNNNNNNVAPGAAVPKMDFGLPSFKNAASKSMHSASFLSLSGALLNNDSEDTTGDTAAACAESRCLGDYGNLFACAEAQRESLSSSLSIDGRSSYKSNATDSSKHFPLPVYLRAASTESSINGDGDGDAILALMTQAFSAIAIILLNKCFDYSSANREAVIDVAYDNAISVSSEAAAEAEEALNKVEVIYTFRALAEHLPADANVASAFSSLASSKASRSRILLCNMLLSGASDTSRACVLDHVDDRGGALQVIGAGGFGSVCKVSCSCRPRPFYRHAPPVDNIDQKAEERANEYAVKRLPRDRSTEDAALLLSTFHEILALQTLSAGGSGSSCTLVAFTPVRSEYWLIMEMGGLSLLQWRQQLPTVGGSLSKEGILSCLLLYIDALYAIADIHAMNIIHFDVKAENFILRLADECLGMGSCLSPTQMQHLWRSHQEGRASGLLFLADFGECCTNCDATASAPALAARCRGTLTIQSPEMLALNSSSGSSSGGGGTRGGVVTVDKACDVWATGCLLIEVIYGRPLFENRMWTDLYVTLCLGPALSPAELLAFGQCDSLEEALRTRPHDPDPDPNPNPALLAAAIERVLGQSLLIREPARRSAIRDVISSLEHIVGYHFSTTLAVIDEVGSDEREHKINGLVSVLAATLDINALADMSSLKREVVVAPRALCSNSVSSAAKHSVIFNVGYLREYMSLSRASSTEDIPDDEVERLIDSYSLRSLSQFATRNIFRHEYHKYHVLSIVSNTSITSATIGASSFNSSSIQSHATLALTSVGDKDCDLFIGKYRNTLADCLEKMSRGLCIVVSIDSVDFDSSSSSTLSTDKLSYTVATALCERLWTIDSPSSLMAEAPRTYSYCDGRLLNTLRLLAQ